MSKTIEEINKVCIERLIDILPFAKEWYEFLKINNYTDETKDVLEKIGMSGRLIEYMATHEVNTKPHNKTDDEFAKSEGFDDWEHSMRNMANCDNEFLLSGFIKLYSQSQTQELQEQNAELVSALQSIVNLQDKYFGEKDIHRALQKKAFEIEDILTKHNHLKNK